MYRRKQGGIFAVLVATLLGCLPGCSGGGGGSGSAEPAVPVAEISGTVTAAANSVIDGDTNDPHSELTPNNSRAAPQAVSAPATIGGFVSARGTGVPGDRFERIGDATDVYRAALLAGQTVVLRIADHPGGSSSIPDLDLLLYAVDSDAAAAVSRTRLATESVTVPAAGVYDVVVEASAGSSNYSLLVGGAGPTGSVRKDFVPGEILVRFARADAGLEGLTSRVARMGLHRMGGDDGRTVLLSLPRDPEGRSASLVALGVADSGGNPAGTGGDEELRRQTLAAVEALRSRPDVVSADPNYVHQPFAVPDDPYLGYQWHYSLIHLPQAWDVETGSTSPVTVAVVDTGVLLSHPDLTGKLVAGYDFVSDPVRANDGTGIDSDPNDPGDGQTPGGSSFHGTHVAGTVAARTDNAIGVSGCSWGAAIMPVRVLGVLGGTSYDILQGIRYAAGLDNDSHTLPPTPADIINLSFGCTGCFSSTEQAVYAAVRASGAILVAAAGNDHSSEPSYPAAYPGVISVSAVDRFKTLAPYSNFGSTVDVAAPGGDSSVDADADGYADGVLSTLGDDGSGTAQPVYGFYQGTSMAAPHVAGVVALMRSANRSFVTADAVDSLLTSGALTDDLGTPGRDDVYGYGLIDAYRAVQAARGAALPTTLSANPGSLYFGPTDTALPLELSVNGAGEVEIDSVTSSLPWLSVAEGSQSLHYDVFADRTGLADGTYSGNLSINYVADGVAIRLTVPALVRVGSAANAFGDTGHTWVLLVDAATNETAYTTSAANQDGTYAYRFASIAPGSYLVVAGSDSDNDGFICDAGESCGGFPTLGQLQAVGVAEGGAQGGIDFLSIFDVGPGTVAAAGAAPTPSAGYRYLRPEEVTPGD